MNVKDTNLSEMQLDKVTVLLNWALKDEFKLSKLKQSKHVSWTSASYLISYKPCNISMHIIELFRISKDAILR